MATPRTIKAAFDQDFVVTKIAFKDSSRIRVSMKRRFPKPDSKNFVDFWIDRKYFERTYPKTYNRF